METPALGLNYGQLGAKKVELKRIVDPVVIRDYTDHYQLPFDAKQNAYALSSRSEKPDIVGEVSATEGRSFLLGSFAYRFLGCRLSEIVGRFKFLFPKRFDLKARLRQVVFNDFVYKGGGSTFFGASTQSNAQDTAPKYFRSAVMGRTEVDDPPAGGVYESHSELDEAVSFLFHSWGGRTRLPIVVMETGPISTEDGLLNEEQSVSLGYTQAGEKLALVGWGLRSRTRVDDLVGLFGGEDGKDYMSTRGGARMLAGLIHPGVEIFTQHPLTEETESKVREFAASVIGRVRNDDDPKWRRLGEKWRTRNLDISEFFLEYLDVLAETTGEQMGILYRKHGYMTMFNFQNVSILGELVDFDHVVFNGRQYIDGSIMPRDRMKKRNMLTEGQYKSGKQPDEARIYGEQLLATFEYMAFVFSILRNRGIISAEGSEFKKRYHEIMTNFGQGFVRAGFGGANPVEIQRNARLVTHIEKELREDALWSDFDNPLVDGAEKARLIGSSYYKLVQSRIRPLLKA